MILENISKHVIELSKQAEIDLKEIYDKIDEVAFYNSNRILSAFIENRVEYADFTDRNGYGIFDSGREKLEKIYIGNNFGACTCLSGVCKQCDNTR